MGSTSKRYKKYYSRKFAIGYAIFFTAAWVLYFLYEDDMIGEQSTFAMIFSSLLYGILSAVFVIILIKLLLGIKKSSSRKRRSKKSEAASDWN